jgi:hypothetical protein
MRILLALFLFSTFALGQNTTETPAPAAPTPAAATPAATPQTAMSATAATPAKPEVKNLLFIPSGTKVPVVLQHAISTKNAREGDPVYAHTTFPLVANDRVLIPAGTYVQGRIAEVQRAGHIKGRAEMLMTFTTLIFPNGYTVMLPGSVDNIPGSDNTKMKGSEGTVQQESQKGKDAEKIATAAGKGAEGGALIGALASRSAGGALGGAGAGAVLGAAIALFGRGNDVRIEAGTTVEMVIGRDISLDASRVPTTTEAYRQPY